MATEAKIWTVKQLWTADREWNKVATFCSCRAAEIPRALEKSSRSRSYSSHTALSRTACSPHIHQAVRMQSAAIPAVYAGARRAAGWGTGQGGSVFAAAA